MNASTLADDSRIGASGLPAAGRIPILEVAGVAETPWSRWWPVVAVMFGMPVVMAPVLWRMILDPSVQVMDTNDFLFHIRIATEEVSILPLDIPAPHPLFHLAVVVLEPLLGASRSALTTMLLSVVLTVLALVLIARSPTPSSPRLSPSWAAVFAVTWIVAESPTALYEWLTDAKAPYAILHFWGSPTEVVFVPFALVLALVVGDIIQRPGRYLKNSASTVVIWGLILVTALAKPTFGLTFAPAALLVVLVSSRWRHSRGTVLRLVVLPAAVVAAGQALFLLVGPVPTGNSGFIIAPMEVFGEVIVSGGPAFWMLPAVMIGLALVVRRRIRPDPSFMVSFVALMVALVPMVLLKETGPRSEDAALLKLGLAAEAVLAALLMRAALVEVRERIMDRRSGGALTWRVPCICVLLGVLLVSGVVIYAQTIAAAGWATV